MKLKLLGWNVGRLEMSRPSSWALITVALALPIGGNAATNDSPGAPRIVFQETTFDFGTVKRGEVVNHTFVYTNNSSQPLQVIAVKPGCGCTSAATWEKEVGPGKTGTIPLQFNSTGFSGNVSKSVNVSFADPIQSNVVLYLNAKVWTPVEVSPASVLFQYTEGTTNTETRTVRIVNNTEEPLTLEQPEISSPAIKANLKTVTPGKEYSLDLTTAPPMPAGTVSSQVKIKTSNKDMPLLTLHVTGIQRAGVTFSPSRLVLQSTPLTATTKVGATIQSHDGTVLVLTEPASTIAGVQVEIREMQPGRLFYLTASFPAGFSLKPGESAEVSVKSNHPKFPTIKLPVVALGLQPLAQPVTLPQTKPSQGPTETPTRTAQTQSGSSK